MEKKSIFSSFIEKYKSQFIPEKDNTLKVSMDGNICVPMNSEYVGIGVLYIGESIRSSIFTSE